MVRETPGRRDLLDTEPLSKRAMRFESGKRFTTPEDRAAMAAEIEALDRKGWVVLPSLLGAEKLAEVRATFERLHRDTPLGDTGFAGHRTQRVYNLAAKTRALDDLLLHPKVLALIEGHIDDQIQLSIATSANLLPGQAGQAPHRDDTYFPLPRPHVPLTTTVMWTIDAFTAENGGTRFAPGSHLTDTEETPAAAQFVAAEAPAGSAILWTGSLFHGGGANRSVAARLGIICGYSRAWLRQQENQFLGVPPDLVRTLSRPLQKLLGYWVVNNFLGYIENGSPRAYLDVREDG